MLIIARPLTRTAGPDYLAHGLFSILLLAETKATVINIDKVFCIQSERFPLSRSQPPGAPDHTAKSQRVAVAVYLLIELDVIIQSDKLLSVIYGPCPCWPTDKWLLTRYFWQSAARILTSLGWQTYRRAGRWNKNVTLIPVSHSGCKWKSVEIVLVGFPRGRILRMCTRRHFQCRQL